MAIYSPPSDAGPYAILSSTAALSAERGGYKPKKGGGGTDVEQGHTSSADLLKAMSSSV